MKEQTLTLDKYKYFHKYSLEPSEDLKEITQQIEEIVQKIIENPKIIIGGEEYEDTIIETDESSL